jgi:iron complex transport system ATP-binding protein
VVVATHHPDEIVPAISHVLLLRGGSVVAQGPRAEVLTSVRLSEAFGLPLRVIEESGRVFVVPRA